MLERSGGSKVDGREALSYERDQNDADATKYMPNGSYWSQIGRTIFTPSLEQRLCVQATYNCTEWYAQARQGWTCGTPRARKRDNSPCIMHHGPNEGVLSRIIRYASGVLVPFM